MASLMQELISTLKTELAEYEKLLQLSQKKTPILVEGKIDELQKVTNEEQDLVDNINNIDKKRAQLVNDIGNVLNKKPKELTLKKLAEILSNQPEEQKELIALQDKLKRTLQNVETVNQQNQALVQQLLEMVAFDMTLVKSMKQAPETANYDKTAANTGELFIGAAHFDAKQ
ncbi:MAG: flagellar protein FlgN [Lachnospiraceae bacterium]|nr:flagellar protein FlgN [Lachnospiraceae bacterium]